MHFDPLATKSGEDSGVGPASANHLGEYRRDGRDRQLTRPHRHDQRAHTIASPNRAVRDRG
jgi:hypothetical protein